MSATVVLHAAWREPDALHVWAEGPARKRTAADGAPPHPFAAAPAAVRRAVESLLPDGVLNDPAALRDDEAELILPTCEDQPFPSHPALEVETPEGLPAGGRWRVPGARAEAATAAGWLAALPARGAEPPGIAVGDDLRWFAEAARLALELVARERCGPTQEARWEPLLSAPGVLERCVALALAMPDACRAGGEAVTPRDELLRNFLRAAVDGFMRTRHEPLPDGGTPAARWLEALGSAGGTVPDSAFADAVREWIAPALSREPYEGYRTCIKLEPPEEDHGRGSRAGGSRRERVGARPWLIRFLLQPVEDPAGVLPAGELWRTSSRFSPERRAAAQDRLLADLVRASRLFPPIGRGLQERLPKTVEVTAAEAYSLLTEAASLLAEEGAAVLIPDALARGRARLSARATLKPMGLKPMAGSAPAGGLGALVRLDFSLAAGKDPITPEELQALIAAREPLVRLRGQWVELRPGDMKDAADLLDRGSETVTVAEALNRAWGAGEAEGLHIAAVDAEGWLRDLLDDRGAATRLEPVEPPRAFAGTLRPYQERGLSWLDFLRRLGAGACLADDMGLGKTVQALALLLRNREEHAPSPVEGRAVREPSLLVAPMSVLGNWGREAARFAPTLKVLLHHGPERLAKSRFARAASQADLVVTSYALLARDRDTLSPVAWDTVLLDEAQNVKNPSSQQASAARSLKANHRIALTGTPVENHLGELWSIFQFLNPGYLGSLQTFRANLAIPIERLHSKGHAERLRRLVGPFLLRRAKSDPGIAPELPPKIETTETCRLTKEQGRLYAAVVQDMMQRIERSEGMERKGLVLATLTKLKQVCDHPVLLLKDRSKVPGRSGKLARLEELLEEVVDEGQRALVFTQFAEMAELLRRHLAATLNGDVLLLHGGTPRAERERLIARFQDPAGGPAVFVISLKAGGTGLNLTAASHVFHFDRWWNPAVEAQATDRAHRIGQHRTVHVHPFVSAGTLEERIAEMLVSKRALAGKIIGDGEAWITELSTDRLKELFSLRAEVLAEDDE